MRKRNNFIENRKTRVWECVTKMMSKLNLNYIFYLLHQKFVLYFKEVDATDVVCVFWLSQKFKRQQNFVIKDQV